MILETSILFHQQADIQKVKDAVGSAVDVMQALGSSICTLLSKVNFYSLIFVVIFLSSYGSAIFFSLHSMPSSSLSILSEQFQWYGPVASEHVYCCSDLPIPHRQSNLDLITYVIDSICSVHDAHISLSIFWSQPLVFLYAQLFKPPARKLLQFTCRI